MCTWADDDTILFTPSSGPNTTLMRVSAAGGTPAVFGALSPGATTQRFPQALPGGQAVLGIAVATTALYLSAARDADGDGEGQPGHARGPRAWRKWYGEAMASVERLR